MPNLTDMPALRIYDLARELAAETEQPIVVWLHLMARDLTTNPDDIDGLILRPEPHWKCWQYAFVKNKTGQGGKWIAENIDWILDQSALAGFRNRTPKVDEPKGLEAALDTEGVTICRDDFQRWCNTAGHRLPAFWFKTEQSTSADKAPTVVDSQLAPNNKGKRPRALRAQVEELVGFGVQANTETLWRELIASCGVPGSCITNIVEDDTRPAYLEYKTNQGKEKPLTKSNLSDYLRRWKLR